jgi:hypothetical protein
MNSAGARVSLAQTDWRVSTFHSRGQVLRTRFELGSSSIPTRGFQPRPSTRHDNFGCSPFLLVSSHVWKCLAIHSLASTSVLKAPMSST